MYKIAVSKVKQTDINKSVYEDLYYNYDNVYFDVTEMLI